jgi:UDP-N-acetyl-D-glucosamine dehydrogenase
MGYEQQLLAKLNERSATVAVVGLGYVGLALACALAEAGHRVIGIDLSIDKVEAINAGQSHIEDVPSSQINRLVSERRLLASDDYDVARNADVAIIAVPTPIDEYRVPDLSYVRSASQTLARVISRGSLVVLESTTYPGTTEEVVVAAFKENGFLPGVDIFIGYSPERIDPGNRDWNISNTPKVVSSFLFRASAQPRSRSFSRTSSGA